MITLYFVINIEFLHFSADGKFPTDISAIGIPVAIFPKNLSNIYHH